MDLAYLLTKIGQISPLNFMAIFLKKLNLGLDLGIIFNGILRVLKDRVLKEMFFRGRYLRIPGPDRSPDYVYFKSHLWNSA
jgi:hypothetical protein